MNQLKLTIDIKTMTLPDDWRVILEENEDPCTDGGVAKVYYVEAPDGSFLTIHTETMDCGCQSFSLCPYSREEWISCNFPM